jgi:hypothetical protein
MLRSQDPETYAAQHQQSPIPPGGRCSVFRQLLRKRNEFRSDRAAAMCAASATSFIRSNSREVLEAAS